MGGFTVASSPSPEVFENESDNGSGNADDAEQEDNDGSPSDDEMST